MNIPWIFKRYEDYPDSFSSSLFSTSINKLITNLYHNIYIRIFGKRIIDPSRFQYPFQIFSRVPLLKKFIFQHVYSPFTRSMNPSARSIKRYSSKITIHRLENSVIRLSNYQSFPPRLCENISLKIPENNRRSRGSHPRADLSLPDQGCQDSKGVRTGGREASEFPSCFEGGDAGEDADARRQIEHPRRDNIITGCFRVRSEAFFPPARNTRYPRLRSAGWKITILPFFRFFRFEEAKRRRLKLRAEEIRRLNRCVWILFEFAGRFFFYLAKNCKN